MATNLKVVSTIFLTIFTFGCAGPTWSVIPKSPEPQKKIQHREIHEEEPVALVSTKDGLEKVAYKKRTEYLSGLDVVQPKQTFLQKVLSLGWGTLVAVLILWLLTFVLGLVIPAPVQNSLKRARDIALRQVVRSVDKGLDKLDEVQKKAVKDEMAKFQDGETKSIVKKEKGEVSS